MDMIKLIEDNFEVQWEIIDDPNGNPATIPTALLGSAIYEVDLKGDLWIDREDWAPGYYRELIWQILEYYPESDVPFELEKPYHSVKDWFPTIKTIWIHDQSSLEYPNRIQCWIEFEALEDVEWRNG